jgi:hypothetical protein
MAREMSPKAQTALPAMVALARMGEYSFLATAHNGRSPPHVAEMP